MAEKKTIINFEFYKNYASELRDQLKSLVSINENKKISEVGSAAGGIITFLKEMS